ncbi:Leucine-Rich Repeat-Containing G-Protein Coupled Receptor 6 [Manis pentadactyla]|nr:Leucine-Rich Repeat-Containing G-Protein Coupled Receptor 6 [Manis pentadactyla]
MSPPRGDAAARLQIELSHGVHRLITADLSYNRRREFCLPRGPLLTADILASLIACVENSPFRKSFAHGGQ